MKTVKKGRPPRKEKRHVIWLTTSTLRLWNERRKAFGLKNKSNKFAEVLLHGMFLKRTGRFDCPDNNNNKGAQRTLVVGGPLMRAPSSTDLPVVAKSAHFFSVYSEAART